MPYLLSLDARLTTYLFHIMPRLSFFDVFFSFLSLSGGFAVWGIVFIFLLILFEERRNHTFLLYFIAGSSFTFLLVNNILKEVFMRTRPLLNNTCPRDFSFPSTHAATAFAAAVMLSYFDKKRAGFYYFVAFLVSFSRIYLGCHYLLDVVFGGLVGYLIVKIILFIKSSYRKKGGTVQKR
ncbi:phosphatase PAP2 family protein [Candidatus Roizmanbacteria bacterium]|nr:phosphatase PAP2 family protein [Candidatus Roizmanbacteria bacterium]